MARTSDHSTVLRVGAPQGGETLVLDVRRDDPAHVVSHLRDSGLPPSTMRNTVVFSVAADVEPLDAMIGYAAVVGFVDRLIDITVDGKPRIDVRALGRLTHTLLDGQLAKGTDTGCVQFGVLRDDLCSGEALTAEMCAAIRDAKRLRYVPSGGDTHAVLSELVVLTWLRCRDNPERIRLPYVCAGDEPGSGLELPVGAVDLDPVRRAALSMRRSVRVDDRSARVDAGDPDERQLCLEAASHVSFGEVVARLGMVEADGIYQCPRCTRYSMIVREDDMFRCEHCDREWLDALRFCVAASGAAPDEIADWLLSNPG